MPAHFLAFAALASFGPRPEYLYQADGANMKSFEVPACPKCLGGGNVKLVEIPSEASTLFDPLPDGWPAAEYEYHCECGWSMPLERHPANSGRPAPLASERGR
ncbi:MAG TPA: hypothetical protein VFB96_00650 [Pirellulaceae bacterium]|jgi:hypothetical protein|nr:hypothetical protein [Pirellulaceae bacterium]